MSSASVRFRRIRRRLAYGALAGLCAALAVLVVSGTDLLQRAEAATYDVRMRAVADPADADERIAIVAIDENSLEVLREELGRWPWPRSAYAAILDYLRVAGARAVVFDITFPEPDVSWPESDAAFAEALADAENVVLAFTLTPGDAASAAEWSRRRAAPHDTIFPRFALGSTPSDWPDRSYGYAEPPYPLFAHGASWAGSVTWNPDVDGVARRERLLYDHRGELYPSLALAAARAVDPDRFAGPLSMRDGELAIGQARIPLHEGRILIRWRGSYLEGGATTYPIYPAFHILNSYEQLRTGREPDVPLEALDGKIVFLAATAAGAFDARATPLRPADPGVMVHATILDNLLAGDPMRRAPKAANIAIVIGAALGIGVLAGAIGSVSGSAVAALLILLLTAATGFLAFTQGVWLDTAAPLLAGGLAFSLAMGGNYMAEGRDKRRVRDLFGRYVPPEYARALADDFETVRLGGERVPITVLFSDIRGFTALSERLPAEAVVRILNEYLDRMAEVVFRHGGTLDKFIGDAVMAFWGAPIPHADHARRATAAALDMLQELDALNEHWRRDVDGSGDFTGLKIGIGLNTGQAVVGNIGSLTRKLDYTAIGDVVNVASRLEGLNKEYGTRVLASDATRVAAGDDFAFTDLGEAGIRGGRKIIRIHEVRALEARGSELGEGISRTEPPAIADAGIVATAVDNER